VLEYLDKKLIGCLELLSRLCKQNGFTTSIIHIVLEIKVTKLWKT